MRTSGEFVVNIVERANAGYERHFGWTAALDQGDFAGLITPATLPRSYGQGCPMPAWMQIMDIIEFPKCRMAAATMGRRFSWHYINDNVIVEQDEVLKYIPVSRLGIVTIEGVRRSTVQSNGFQA